MLEVKKKIERVKKKYEQKLLLFPNVVGLGIGFKEGKDVCAKKLCLKVYVKKKIPLTKLLKDQIVPKKIQGIETDIEEVGRLNVK